MQSPLRVQATRALAVSSQTPESLASRLRCSPEVARRLLDELCRDGDAIEAGGIFLRVGAVSMRGATRPSLPDTFGGGYGFADDDDAPVTEVLSYRHQDLLAEDVDDMPTEMLSMPLDVAMYLEEEDDDDSGAAWADDEWAEPSRPQASLRTVDEPTLDLSDAQGGRDSADMRYVGLAAAALLAAAAMLLFSTSLLLLVTLI